jgi:hypothetical protein
MAHIVKYEFKRSRIYDIKNEMIRCELFYKTRITKIIQFEGWAIGFLLLSKAVKEDNSLFEEYTKADNRKKIIESLDTIGAFDYSKQYQVELFEKAYLDLYQAFECFILDCYPSIFCTYPKLLRLFNEKISGEYSLDEKLFIDNNEDIINDLIDETLDKLSRSKSIIEQIETLNKLPLEINLTKKDSEQIKIFSKNRNQLIHNAGRISKAFIKKLEQMEIEHNFEIGNFLTRDYLTKVPLNNYNDLLNNTVKYISNRIASANLRLQAFNADFK